MTTKTTIALADLVEKGADSDLLRDMIQYVSRYPCCLPSDGGGIVARELTGNISCEATAGAGNILSESMRKNRHFALFLSQLVHA